MNFKLRYRISRETNIEPRVLIKRVQLQLNDKKYRIINITDRSVKFDFNPFMWMLRRNGSPIHLDGGEFDISPFGSGTVLMLDYYINLLTPLIVVLITFSSVIIKEDYSDIPFFVLLYLIMGFVYNRCINKNAKELLNAIVNIPK